MLGCHEYRIQNMIKKKKKRDNRVQIQQLCKEEETKIKGVKCNL